MARLLVATHPTRSAIVLEQLLTLMGDNINQLKTLTNSLPYPVDASAYPAVKGYGMNANLPDLRNLTLDQATQILKNNGFKPKSLNPSAGGWQIFNHTDGSRVDIHWPTGRVVRSEAPLYGPERSPIHRPGLKRVNEGQRIDYNGNLIPRPIFHSLHPPETLNINP